MPQVAGHWSSPTSSQRQRLFAQIREGSGLGALLWRMAALSVLSAASYGVTVGIYAGGWQPPYNAIKLP